MSTYRVYWQGREIGALGIFYLLGSHDVEATSRDEAVEKSRTEYASKLYDKYEHLQVQNVIDLSEADEWVAREWWR